jgi:hypothetical protein
MKFKLNKKGVNALLRGDEMQTILEQIGGRVAVTAGEGNEHGAHYTKQRVIVNVWAAAEEAQKNNRKNNALLKALGRG